MLLRKINAILSLFTTLFLLYHAIFNSVWMLSKGSVGHSAPFAPWILAGFMAAHAFISLILAFSVYFEDETCKCKSYPKMNRAAFIQRISGVLLLIFTGLHIAGASGAMQPPHIIHTIVPPLFYLIALVHTAVSVDKAFVTLGIGNAKFIKAVGVVIKVICAVTLVTSVTGFYLYLW